MCDIIGISMFILTSVVFIYDIIIHKHLYKVKVDDVKVKIDDDDDEYCLKELFNI